MWTPLQPLHLQASRPLHLHRVLLQEAPLHQPLLGLAFHTFTPLCCVQAHSAWSSGILPSREGTGWQAVTGEVWGSDPNGQFYTWHLRPGRWTGLRCAERRGGAGRAEEGRGGRRERAMCSRQRGRRVRWRGWGRGPRARGALGLWSRRRWGPQHHVPVPPLWQGSLFLSLQEDGNILEPS